MAADPISSFGPATQAWFRASFPAATPVQARGWAAIAGGHHTLMLAPTGSGKTLAAFLWCLDRLARAELAPGTRVVYVSPIKALAYDIERNLRAPLAGLQQLGAGAALKVDVRTGDTPARERERQRKDPGQILITTPEWSPPIRGRWRARAGDPARGELPRPVARRVDRRARHARRALSVATSSPSCGRG